MELERSNTLIGIDLYEYTSWSDKLDLEWWEEDYGSDAKELMENWLEQTQEERGEEW